SARGAPPPSTLRRSQGGHSRARARRPIAGRSPSRHSRAPPRASSHLAFSYHAAVHRPRGAHRLTRRHAGWVRADSQRRARGLRGACALHDRARVGGEGDVTTMRLRILLPTKILADEAVAKVTADGTHGNFAILPR